MDHRRRSEGTFRDAMFPILQASVEHFRSNRNFLSYALEISLRGVERVPGRAGITLARPEDIVVVLPAQNR